MRGKTFDAGSVTEGPGRPNPTQAHRNSGGTVRSGVGRMEIQFLLSIAR
jgi:hypothetical protein